MIVTDPLLQQIRDAFGPASTLYRLDLPELRRRWGDAVLHDPRIVGVDEDNDAAVVRDFVVDQLVETVVPRGLAWKNLPDAVRREVAAIAGRLKAIGLDIEGDLDRFSHT